jgi:short-subunit dehydrogenase
MGSGLSMTLLMPGATETNFFKNAGQASTTVGSMKRTILRSGKRAWYALMTGHEFVYGSEYAEYEGEVMNRMMSENHTRLSVTASFLNPILPEKSSHGAGHQPSASFNSVNTTLKA